MLFPKRLGAAHDEVHAESIGELPAQIGQVEELHKLRVEFVQDRLGRAGVRPEHYDD